MKLDTVTQQTARDAYYRFAEQIGVTPLAWENLSGEQQVELAQAFLTLGNIFVSWEAAGLTEEQQRQALKTLLQAQLEQKEITDGIH